VAVASPSQRQRSEQRLSDRAEPDSGVNFLISPSQHIAPAGRSFSSRTLFCALILTNKWLIALSAAGESSSSSVAWPWPHPVP
jgi:hypothetical protein